jgi:hypothetical protein
VLNASPARVYQVLVDPKQFRKVTDFVLPAVSTSINPEAGDGELSAGGVPVAGALI